MLVVGSFAAACWVTASRRWPCAFGSDLCCRTNASEPPSCDRVDTSDNGKVGPRPPWIFRMEESPSSELKSLRNASSVDAKSDGRIRHPFEWQERHHHRVVSAEFCRPTTTLLVVALCDRCLRESITHTHFVRTGAVSCASVSTRATFV